MARDGYLLDGRRRGYVVFDDGDRHDGRWMMGDKINVDGYSVSSLLDAIRYRHVEVVLGKRWAERVIRETLMALDDGMEALSVAAQMRERMREYGIDEVEG